MTPKKFWQKSYSEMDKAEAFRLGALCGAIAVALCLAFALASW